jgi:hypothetical protein
VKELMGNETLREALHYAPERVYRDKEGTNQVFDETWTAEWWWEIQVNESVRNELSFMF